MPVGRTAPFTIGLPTPRQSPRCAAGAHVGLSVRACPSARLDRAAATGPRDRSCLSVDRWRMSRERVA